MNITKFGHCALLIEESGIRILTDPGSYSTIPENLTDIDIVLITHEHQDHFHIDSIKKILETNPKIIVITNKSVASLLVKENISCEIVADGDISDRHGVEIEGFGKKHAEIYKDWNQIENTGYFINGKFFYPGDAFYDPRKRVEILALPVAGPWCKVSEAIEYALALKPTICFPVHDGGLKQPAVAWKAPSLILPKSGIEFTVLEIGKTAEF